MSKNKQTPKLTSTPSGIHGPFDSIEEAHAAQSGMTAIEEKAKERIAELVTAPLPYEPMRLDPGQLRDIFAEAGHLPPVDEDADLEFAAVIVKFQEVLGPLPRSMAIDQTPAKTIEGFVNDGWQIDETIACPPFALIVFSREREEIEEEVPQDEQ